jgi:shikimate kinase
MKQSGPIVICGFMGCGKSRVSWELARRLDVPMVDLDTKIMAREERTPAQLINEDGEAAFRLIESNTLRELLQADTAAVIALGGGAWIEKTNRDLIDQYSCISVWLDVPFAMCWERIKAAAGERPLGKTRQQALALYERRKPIYQLAAIHISVLEGENLDNLISRIARELATRRH